MKPGPLWGKKDKHCDPAQPADQKQGSYWDHVLIDAETKLIVSLVVGKRTTETALEAWVDFYQRTDGQLPPLITTDEYAVYWSVIVSIYGVRKETVELTDTEKEQLGWATWPPVYFPVEIAYATVHKTREQGRVVRVEPRIVAGTKEQVAEVLARGKTAASINTCYVERWNGTQRHINARKARKVYTFSKDLLFHVAVTWLCVVAYNFCWKPRTLRQQIQVDPPRYHYRTPAMAAGIAAEEWSIQQVLYFPVYPVKEQSNQPNSRYFQEIDPDGG
jgi:IS1 family transposase